MILVVILGLVNYNNTPCCFAVEVTEDVCFVSEGKGTDTGHEQRGSSGPAGEGRM